MSATISTAVVSPSQQLRLRSAVCPLDGRASRTELVADQLLGFVRIPGLQYRLRPTPLTDGWETYTYVLELEEHAGLPAWLRGPLVLRIYATEKGAPRARHEFA